MLIRCFVVVFPVDVAARCTCCCTVHPVDPANPQAETILGLLDQGADVHGFNSDRDRPLHVAAYFGRVEAVKFLLDAEADVNAAGSMGDTPLHAAVRGDHRFAKVMRYMSFVPPLPAPNRTELDATCLGAAPRGGQSAPPTPTVRRMW